MMTHNRCHFWGFPVPVRVLITCSGMVMDKKSRRVRADDNHMSWVSRCYNLWGTIASQEVLKLAVKLFDLGLLRLLSLRDSFPFICPILKKLKHGWLVV